MSTRIISLNPFGTGQCLSTKTRFHCCSIFESQSLWNRAVSFDQYPKSLALMDELVSIPLEQGSVFRLLSRWRRCWACPVSIPLEQGSVFRRSYRRGKNGVLSQSLWNRAVSFDPKYFGDKTPMNVSQSLWNRAVSFDSLKQAGNIGGKYVSIPLEQGSVFRLQWYFEALWHKAYESHFPTFSET